MSIFLAFAFAVLFSFVGVLPPGIVNMTVANYSVKKSLKKARKFINGAILIVFIQSILGFYFATFLESHPQVMQNLKLVGSLVFILLTLFFLGKGIQKVSKKQTKTLFTRYFYFGIKHFPNSILCVCKFVFIGFY